MAWRRRSSVRRRRWASRVRTSVTQPAYRKNKRKATSDLRKPSRITVHHLKSQPVRWIYYLLMSMHSTMMSNYYFLFFALLSLVSKSDGFTQFLPWARETRTSALYGGGFGGSSASKGSKKNKKKINRLVDSLEEKPKESGSANMPFVKSEQDTMLEQLAAKSASTCIGKAVASAPVPPEGIDPFWELMPSLISSRFPNIPDKQLERVAGMVKHALDPNLPLEDSIINDPYRPHDEIHAYMPGLGETKPFYDADQLTLCRLLSENYDTILAEYEALLQHEKAKFQSVTSMNYESGWKTLVLFYNGHRIKDFPYKICPTTTKILESVPLAGRIAGFNRQQPNSGIPLHSDGNNMWLTCQMGLKVPEGKLSASPLHKPVQRR